MDLEQMWTAIWDVKGIQLAIGFLAGFLSSRFTLSASERKKVQQEAYENGDRHRVRKEERFQAFVSAMTAFAAKRQDGEALTLIDFQSMAVAGELYFSELKIISDAILSGKIDSSTRDRTFVPTIHEALSRSIPTYYGTLRDIAAELGVPYGGEYRPENYKSLVDVAEKYGSRLVTR